MILLLKHWWHQRIPRERTLIITGTVVVAVLLIDVLIWQPLNNAVAQMQQNVIQNHALLTLMQDAKEKMRQWQQAGYSAASTDSAGLLVTVEQTLTKTGLSRHLTNTSEQSENMIALSFSGVPFDALIDWQQILWANNNVVVSKESIKKGSTEGVVDVTMTLMNP